MKCQALLCAAALAGCAGDAKYLETPPLMAEVPQGRLLYVARESGDAPGYRIEMVDLGASAPRVLARSGEPLAFPRWSPDAHSFAYVALEHGKASLRVRPLGPGLPRKLVLEADALGAPSWSPDGATLAYSMQRDGSSDLYVVDLSTQLATRLTQDAGNETEPAWAPDGRSMLYVSDRSGSPQVYDLALRRAKSRLAVPDAPAALHASYSPDGHAVLFMLRDESGDSVELLDLDSGERTSLGPDPADEAPVFSPDGRFVAYTTHADGHAIELVSADGRVRQSLKTSAEVREPSWAPPPR